MVDGAPEIMALAANFDEHLVQVPPPLGGYVALILCAAF